MSDQQLEETALLSSRSCRPATALGFNEQTHQEKGGFTALAGGVIAMRASDGKRAQARQ